MTKLLHSHIYTSETDNVHNQSYFYVDDLPGGVECSPRYDEPQYLADVEEHLGVTIQQAASDCKVGQLTSVYNCTAEYSICIIFGC